MANFRDSLKTELGIDETRLSPLLRECLQRLETLEDEADQFGRYMALPVEKQREAWRLISAENRSVR